MNQTLFHSVGSRWEIERLERGKEMGGFKMDTSLYICLAIYLNSFLETFIKREYGETGSHQLMGNVTMEHLILIPAEPHSVIECLYCQ